MKNIFVSGSMRIKNINKLVLERIENIIHEQFTILVGDADGVDASIQQILAKIYQLLTFQKTSIVFVNKLRKFFNISSFEDFEYLVSIMSESAFEKANKKIKLKEKIISNKNKQLSLFPEANKALHLTRNSSANLGTDSGV
ncbi:MAG: hypothetical protein JRC89_06990 [Deltaproteobacteria bacterium]|nr:hypothetical protein [Deltaproteobacteria bacterium]